MKIGIIGTGNMGRILTEALLDGKAVSPSSMIITNRTLMKAIAIQENLSRYSYFTRHIEEIGKQADLIFICVKPHDVYEVTTKLKPYLTKEKCVISITSPISVRSIGICSPLFCS